MTPRWDLGDTSAGPRRDLGDTSEGRTEPTDHVDNPTKCIDTYTPDFVSSDLSKELYDYLEGLHDFSENMENGHSVKLFGYPYHYVGSKHKDKATDIPDPLKKVISLITAKYHEQEPPNSCLINKYCGPEALLPKHSDNEFSIDPKSSIFTVSLGKSVKVKFTEINDESVEEIEAEPNSLYVMSRKSQNYWQHEIQVNSLAEGEVRYSITLRHVSDRFRKSTIVIGDSNTSKLNFGEGKGTFGHLIPGERVEAIHIEDIDPSVCCGYRNVFIHCGINNIKHHKVNSKSKITECFNDLRNKIDEILHICPNSNVVVSPILPTKRQDWNSRAVLFNNLLFQHQNVTLKFTTLRFGAFVDHTTGLLSDDLGTYWNARDVLHLGSKGIRMLVKLIRETVYSNKTRYRISYRHALHGNTAAEGKRSHGASQPHRTSSGAP